jgi:hypothetical protein
VILPEVPGPLHGPDSFRGLPRNPTCHDDTNYGTVCDDPAATITLTGSDAFAYDLTGNPTNHGAAVGAGNRLATYDGYALGYDVDANLTSKTKTGCSQALTWNSLGQLAALGV